MAETKAANGKAGKRPTHRVWHVEGMGEAASWTEICALWPTKKGTGLSGGVDSFLPAPGGHLQGRIVVLPAKYRMRAANDDGGGKDVGDEKVKDQAA